MGEICDVTVQTKYKQMSTRNVKLLPQSKQDSISCQQPRAVCCVSFKDTAANT